MTDTATQDAYGIQVEPATLKIQRLLPGPIERVWAFLIDAGLRRQWLADGVMEPRVGAAFELTWRNDRLSDAPTRRPEGFPAEHSMRSRITELDAPRRLSFTWQKSGSVSFELEPIGEQVRLTVIHRRLDDHETRLMVGAGWHMHLDLLVACVDGSARPSFWDGWIRLRQEYAQRLTG